MPLGLQDTQLGNLCVCVRVHVCSYGYLQFQSNTWRSSLLSPFSVGISLFQKWGPWLSASVHGRIFLSSPITGFHNASVPSPTTNLPFSGVALTKHHKLSGFKTIDICSLSVLESRSPKSKHWQGRAPPECCRGESACFFLRVCGLLATLDFS